ncbi:MAG: M23 family metallopeptidase [Verrucomicrobiota bacterium JB022]|nr:M23 family metallopeptidase [Verrucomicrobiota bacterium JB022]
MRKLSLSAALLLFNLRLAALPLAWPIGGPSIIQGDQLEAWAQATATGDPNSALFGCVRNSGHRFHEAIDIAATQWDNRREATDPVKAVMRGKVVHISPIAGHSSYGRYVVVEHPDLSPALYTLYAHLRSIEDGLQVGQQVELGDTLGVLGRSATYSIPRERAHVHLEIGVRLSDNFQAWYDRQPFGSKNEHGIWNGMNLVGLDPQDFYQHFKGEVTDLKAYLGSLPPAAILQLRTNKVPDLVKRYPALLEGSVPSQVLGWEVTLTGYGFPLNLRPLQAAEAESLGELGTVKVVAVNPDELDKFGCRDLVKWNGTTANVNQDGSEWLALIFNLRD